MKEVVVSQRGNYSFLVGTLPFLLRETVVSSVGNDSSHAGNCNFSLR